MAVRHCIQRFVDKLNRFFRKYQQRQNKDTIASYEDKPEIQEVSKIYTDTWDKIIFKEILKKYTANGKEILLMNPDFEGIEFIEPIKDNEGKYTEHFHLEEVEKNIITVYEKIKSSALSFDKN
ncbi:MAG: hypothetical protein V1915_04720 [Candidatus Bathyarchaeota archaeon]